MAILGLVILLGAVATVVAVRRHRATECRAERALSEKLLPEIRALLKASDPRSPSQGVPPSALLYDEMRAELVRSMREELRFAVEAFYGSLASYRHASELMTRAFQDSSDEGPVSLGDRIRAKDQRDRLLKDVYDSGAFAIEKLERGGG